MTIIREMKFIVFITIINILLISTYQATINSIDNNNAQSLHQGNNDEDDTVIVEASRSTDNSSKPKIVNRINEQVDTDDDGPICVCVPYYLCDPNNTVITDGAGVIDIRSKPVSCSNALEVCCNAPLNESTIPTLPPRYIDGTTEVGCGRRNFDGAGVRIKGDVNNEAQYGEFPWMIAVIRSEKVNENITLSLFQCGGSLIHPRVIMTAAHCVARTDKTKLFVRAGEWDTQTKNERFPHEEQKVSEVIVHEKFYSGGLFNDIALLITPQPFNLSHHIDTVCLPNQNHVQENVVCTATGWGKDEFGKTGKYQVILKKIDLPMVPRERCQTELRTTRLGKYFKLHESFVCAGGEAGHDTCKGDGGGPLVCPVNPKSILSTRFHQTGIVAWGISCGDERIPGVYANVALFRYWIDNWMRQLQFDTKYYTL